MNNAALLDNGHATAAAKPAGGWERVRAGLKSALGEVTFKSWLSSLQYEGSEARQALFTVPTRFTREWILAHYAEDILRIFKVEDPSLISIDIRVRPIGGQKMLGATPFMPAVAKEIQPFSQTAPSAPKPVPVAEPASQPVAESQAIANQMNVDVSGSSLYIGAPLDPRFTFENFVVGKPNELAHAAARRVAENEVVVQGCNPLFLYGGVGLGKTHLMHSIAWHIRRTNPERKVIYLSAEKFMYQFIRALRFKEALAFKEQFRSVDVLMIDDVQFICGKDSTQEEFFHTFNALVDQNKQLIISCDRSPFDLDGMEERVRSRLGWGLVADINSTTYELRLGILQSKVEKIHGIQVQPKVLEFLAHKITSNIRELEGALNRVVAHSTLVGRAITLENTQEVLHDVLRANDRQITIEEIQKQVANHYNVKVSDMHSARRARTVARPRQVAMYLAKKLTSKSLPEIGRRFGGKDHTTVMHAVKKVEELCKTDNDFSHDVELLTKIFQGA